MNLIRQRRFLTVAVQSAMLICISIAFCSCKKQDPIEIYNQEHYRVAHAFRLCNEKYANGIELIGTERLGQWAKESQPFETQMRAIRPPKGWERYHQVLIDMVHMQSHGLNEAYNCARKGEGGKRDAALAKMGDEMAVCEQRLVDETKKLGYRVDSLQARVNKSKAYWQSVKKSLKPL